MYDLIIIGAGPAGITAGIYAARQKLNTLIITKDFGGQVAKKAVDIENYPGFEKISGPELIKKFVSHLKKYPVKIEKGEVVKIKKNKNKFSVLTAKQKRYEAVSVIISSGADPRPLEVPGEKEFIGKGVSYCSLCDGFAFKNKTVAVVGGGNSAFETAIFLSNYVKKIYILEYGPKVKADAENQLLVKKTGKTEIITNASLKEIKGDNFVNSIVYQDLNLKKEVVLKIDGVFIEIGYQPVTSFVKNLVDFTERDEIKVSAETQETRTPGLFAAGDTNAGTFRQIITACGEGAKAALAAYSYIKRIKND